MIRRSRRRSRTRLAVALLIDAETIRPHWTGERLDYDLAIGSLHWKKHGDGSKQSHVQADRIAD